METRTSSDLERYRRLRLSSPVLWKAAQRRARLVMNASKKRRMAATLLLPFMRVIKLELAEGSFAEPSKQNVEDALRAMILDTGERQRAFRLYEQLLRIHSMFRLSQHLTKKKPAK